jgi:uncharacterized protein YkwD
MTDPRRGRHLLLLVALLLPVAAAADVVDAVNAVRRTGCDGRPGGVPPLRENRRLDEVAHRLAQGAPLEAAEQRSGYHAVSSFSVEISGVPPSGDVAAILGRQFCPQATNAAFRELGSYARGGDVWLAFAEPFAPPAAGDLGAISRRVLALTNAARGHPRRCGATAFAAVPPLTLNATLARVALDYAHDMAAHGYMDHTGRDGSSPQGRVTRAGYRWREVGENLAGGVMTAEAVVDGWLQSAEHCANLMDPVFREMGVAFAVNPHDERGVYWALEFGTPR